MDNGNAYRELGNTALTTLLKESLQRPLVILLKVEWSGTSHIMDAFMEDLSEKYQTKIQFYHQNAEVHQEPSTELDFTALPFTFILKNGQMVDAFEGMLSQKKIEQKLNQL